MWWLPHSNGREAEISIMAAAGTDGETCTFETQNSRGNSTEHDGGVTFEISFEAENRRPRSAPPKRLRSYQKKGITKEEIQKKQEDAQTRRKESEKEMIDRIQQKREECRRLNENFEVLLAQDAKLHGAAGTTDIPKMSKGELVQKFRSVQRDYCKMAVSIDQHVAPKAAATSNQ